MSEELRDQVNELIRDEIQETINEYVDSQKEQGVGFVSEKDKELKVNISKTEVDKLIKEYKKIKKYRKSNLGQVKLLDKHGKQME